MNIYIYQIADKIILKNQNKTKENILEFPPIIIVRHTIMQEKSNERSHKKCLNKTEK